MNPIFAFQNLYKTSCFLRLSYRLGTTSYSLVWYNSNPKMDVVEVGYCLRMRSAMERRRSMPDVVYDIEVLMVGDR